ncbi:uncharacterized protein LOC113563111 [Ooceraea biroi]|uniref:uncharacterized protein LOC113563111 n=1 Tax=Ooceraea biroi TaxID=2015173 RepID=UPI000F07EB98|nr:uncharacterized protein LOC113563111 [Ooceraea biroi]
MIMQEPTVQQLKKLWANMKQGQREILTKEKQARLATGGGPPPSETNIDPDIALINPHLMKTAPVLFSSNMTADEINTSMGGISRSFQIISSQCGWINVSSKAPKFKGQSKQMRLRRRSPTLKFCLPDTIQLGKNLSTCCCYDNKRILLTKHMRSSGYRVLPSKAFSPNIKRFIIEFIIESSSSFISIFRPSCRTE